MTFPDFESVERHLNSLINYEHAYPLGGARDRPKLEPVLLAVERLGLAPALPNCVHIAGTKGKGSVVAFLEALLAPDESVLSFTSPHLVSVRERIRFGGRPLDDQVWQQGFARFVPSLASDPAIKLSYFESVFVFFLWVAREMGTSVHLMEAGLGGRFDATNVIENALAVLTSIDYDHTDVLGNTLTEIARDKSGIIKPGATAIIGRQPEEAAKALAQAGDDAGAHLLWFGKDFGWEAETGGRLAYVEKNHQIAALRLAVEGAHQRDNAAVAIRVARALRPDFAAEAIRERMPRA